MAKRNATCLLGALLAILILLPDASDAQDWATRAFCDAPPRAVSATDFAPHDLAKLEAEAGQIANGLGRFWQVTSPNGKRSHLWGTSHVSHPAILNLPSAVTDAIANARVVALEVDLTFHDRDGFLDQFDLPGRYRDPGDPFSGQEELDLGFLGRDVESWVIDRLFGYGAFEDALYVLTYAGLAELMLSDPCEDFTAGTIPVQDDYIHTLARMAGADILALEQVGDFLLDLEKDEETARAVLSVYATYLQPQDTPDARVAGFQLYIEGRLGLLSAWDRAHVGNILGSHGLAALERTDAYLLSERNRRFLARAAAELDAGGVFMAIGAAHLPGEQGLVALLRDTGYSVTRIVLPGEAE